NLTASRQLVILPRSTTLAPGATVAFDADSVGISALDSVAIHVALSVDNTVTPWPTQAPYAYSGQLQFACSGVPLQLPVTFHKSGLLAISTDALPEAAFIENASTHQVIFADFGGIAQVALP